jgi:hypothetical protein
MKTKPFISAPADPAAYNAWLNGIVSLQEGAALRSVHPDTLKRLAARGRVQLLRVSARRWGVRRRDALMLGDGDPRDPP